MKKTVLGLCVGVAVMGAAQSASADSSCWSPAEVRAYDITMHTLMLAHVAAACDATAKADPPLRARLATFLSENGKQLDTDREALTQYFRRAYGDDWQAPLQSSLDREDKRVTEQVKQSATPSFCEGAADALEGLSEESWDQFVTDATEQGWDQKAGLPKCR